MRYPRLVIALSMMVVLPAVADNSATAEEGDSGAAATPAAGATEADAGTATGESAAQPNHGRHAKPDAVAPPQRGAAHEPIFAPARDNHKLQTGLSIMPGTGYRFIVPYKDQTFCGDRSHSGDKRVCANFVPAFLDFQLSFGAMSRFDVIIDMRIGLQEDPAVKGNHQFALAPGLRFWLDQDVALKFYTTLQFVFDYTDFSTSPGVRSSDYGARNASGLMYDPIRNVGFYVQFGETFGFVRWFRIDLDIGIGAQIRFP